ncbi:N-acetylglucosamine-6-phosphate deacetylase [Saccharobesus litoralis]|uniref:N-acetylgalactosamine-6-phosphate deacetylase n=1 Tax=Saccharobesus litoralis TaxID=2172099 RepID=A0A2S0VV18_9ALTE|nr:N-acetylglucosamine-6-phosphate deacetylase [Saccharobesus litoralis]AWB68067.1 N-acetylglucosamine-6-phosphate deacetylase [Saccharobesus litoralis]
MKQHYRPTRFFNGQGFIDNAVISVENGVICGIDVAENEVAENLTSKATNNAINPQDITRLNGTLAPGYIDVQVNGGGGVLFNNQPTLASLQAMFNAHRQYGTTALLPTLITDDIDVMQQAADAVAQAIKQPLSGIVGIHFEGPHLSVPKKGVHPAQHIRHISDQEWQLFSRNDLGIKKVTLAPEAVSPEEIQRLTELNVIVSLGHSNATYEQTQAALAAGATGFTHLFNAMSPLTSREPGVVGAALAAQQTYCGIIIDHHHVHSTSANLAYRLKSADKLVLVTDAMALIGSKQSHFNLFGEQVALQGDKLTIDTGQLAGSHLSMQQAVQNSVNDLHIELGDCLKMASLTPATWLGLDEQMGKIAVGYRADWVLLNDDLSVQQTWVAGQAS